jgi:hypothetical protein
MIPWKTRCSAVERIWPHSLLSYLVYQADIVPTSIFRSFKCFKMIPKYLKWFIFYHLTLSVLIKITIRKAVAQCQPVKYIGRCPTYSCDLPRRISFYYRKNNWKLMTWNAVSYCLQENWNLPNIILTGVNVVIVRCFPFIFPE